MASRQPKPGSATKGSRQRLLKPLASVHGQSPLRLNMSVQDLDKSTGRTPNRTGRSASKTNPIRVSYREIEENSDDSSEEFNNDKENVNPREGPIKPTSKRSYKVKEPLAEIFLKDDDQSEYNDSFRSGEANTLDSDFHEGDSENDDTNSIIWKDIKIKGAAPRMRLPTPRRLTKGGRTLGKDVGETTDTNLLSGPKDYENANGGQDLVLEKALQSLTLEDPPKLSGNVTKGYTETLLGPEDQELEKVPATPKKTRSASTGTTTSPSKSRLNSPTKSPRKENQERIIPPTPHRPSIDAFWSQEVVNSWNDEYSPKRVIGSPRKGALQRMIEEIEGWSDLDETEQNGKTIQASDGESVGNEAESQVPQSPKSPAKSPSKKQLAQQAREAKAAVKAAKDEFLNSREALAASFLQELDLKVAGGRVAELTHDSGGVKILWSATLRSTAGRANWRREAIRRTHEKPVDTENASRTMVSSGKMLITPGSNASNPITLDRQTSFPSVQYRHVANIELATKVITTKDRLLNVLAHEFCHLANFMISNVKDQPHGKSFKGWASKVTHEFRDRGVLVTTKHDWEVEYKYEWVCAGRLQARDQQHGADADIEALMRRMALERAELTMDEEGCGTLYQRHSKSIDPSKHRCGKCKGTLVQTKPAPRKQREN